MILNRLTYELRDVCRDHVLEEKWLIAPSLRVGFKWLDRIARSGQPLLNVRVKTLLHMALDLASPEMGRRGQTLLRGVRSTLFVDRIVERLKGTKAGYLSALEPSPGLTRTVQAALRDLRLVGLEAGRLRMKAFEVEEKGGEIRLLLQEYEKELAAKSLVDYTDVLRMAMARITEDPRALPNGLLVILPGDAEKNLLRLERELWSSIPTSNRVLIREDVPGEDPGAEITDTALLGWISRPTEAPDPQKDKTAGMFRAVGEANEVREVLRTCMEKKIPLDDVEILHTDAATYVPLIYEIAWRLKSEDDESIPVTFSEGVPPRYSRPARALMGWLTWIREDYSQSVLVRMIRDGLLKMEGAGREGLGFARLAVLFRKVPIGNGKDRTLASMGKEIASAEARIQQEREGTKQDIQDQEHDKEDQSHDRKLAGLLEKLKGLKKLRTLVRALMECTPEPHSPRMEWVSGALTFLEIHSRRLGQFDEYSHAQLVKEIREFADCLEEEPSSELDLPEWLWDLTQASHVGGLGPLPGCMYVAPLHAGGHSGRRHTFIIGLDDTRFPGAGLQDPLLLDAERFELSSDLPTASGRLARRMEEFSMLMARLRGSVTLSYCCHDLIDDREMFPSPVALSAFRILSGQRQGDQKDLLAWLPEPASFAPGVAGRCVTSPEWWLCRMFETEGIKDPETVLAREFPHLGRGMEAHSARDSDRFTEYDGYVPEAGREWDPFGPEGRILSASRLEKLGTCPLEFFFQYVLGIEQPEEFVIDPEVWLDSAQRGRLLHEVFRRFMCRVQGEGRSPAFLQDWDLIKLILGDEVQAWKARVPLPNPGVLQREVRELQQIVRIFLLEEENFSRHSTPFCFEAGLGLPPEGEGTPLDTPEPVELRLSGGKRVRARGRIDRVDRLPDGNGERFSIWDYKTGSSWKYRKGQGRPDEDPFNGGRIVQNALYMKLVEERLRQEISSRSRVYLFGYFFPNLQEHGERFQWTSDQLAKGKEILERLCTMIANGCFPFTDNSEDVRFSPYLDAFGDVEETIRTVVRKLENRDNHTLGPFQRLRGYSRDDPTS